MRALSCAILLILCGAVAHADDERSITFDMTFDFSRVRTFALRPGTVTSQKPELNNRLFVQTLDRAMRDALVARGLKEAPSGADVTVTFSVTSQDYSTVGGQRGTRIPDGPRGSGVRGVVIPGTGPIPELFTEATLVIAMTTATGADIWRGSYRDEERTAPRLARNLPGNARELISRYPPNKR